MSNIKAWALAAAIVLAAVTAVVWLRATGDTTPGATSAYQPVDGPPIATSASFTVQVTSFSRDADARVLAGRLMKAGLPAYAWRLDGSQRDVLVGPFVSIDEAEAAQREVAKLGYPGTRLHVDERLRATGIVSAAVSDKSSPAVVLVAAPGRLAVTFELAAEPQQVSGQRVDAMTFAVTTSAIDQPIQSQEWNASSDVQLVKHVSVAADPKGARGLDARVIVAEHAVATVRVVGSRVYVDVSRAQLDLDERPAARAVSTTPVQPVFTPRAAEPANAASTPSAGDSAAYREAIGPIFARFEEIQPFLRGTVAAPTPEVLVAVAGTFTELEDALRAIDVPRTAQGAHGLMTSAVQLAKGAAAPTFSGDRMTQVREAMAQFQAAKAQLR